MRHPKATSEELFLRCGSHLLFTLVLALAGSNEVGADPLQKVKSMSDVTEEQPLSESRSGVPGSQNEITTVRFQVTYTTDYGYALYLDSDLNNTIELEFVSEKVEQDFDVHYRSLLKASKTRIMCDCTGQLFKRDGVDVYRIMGAHLAPE